MTMLDEQGLGAFIDSHYRRAGDRLFRMERLPLYDVPHQLADEQRRGLVSQRVRRFGHELSDDEVMSCHWGYAHNGQYEDIRVLHDGEHEVPAGLIELDYWIVADRYAVAMSYDAGGRFTGAEVVEPGRSAEFVGDCERAWAAAEPFALWWARHPELHRSRAA